MAIWQRMAVRPEHKQKVDILAAVSGEQIYTFLGKLIDAEWEKVKASGKVSDAMIALESAMIESKQPVYTNPVEVA